MISEQAKVSSELNNTKELLTKANAELCMIKKNSQVLNKKINFTKKVTEDQLLAAIENPDSLSENPHIISVYSATLNEDDFILDEAQETVKPIKEEFFKNMESQVDPADSAKVDRLNLLRHQVLEKVKVSKKAVKDLLVCVV